MNPTDPSPASQKSGLSGLAIAGIGCGGLVLLGVLAVVVLFKWTAVRVNNATADVSYDGKKPNTATATLTVDGPDGTTITSNDPAATFPPNWVPAYPAAQAQADGMKHETKDTINGTYRARTTDEPGKVKEYFESTLQADGFETSITTTDTDGAESVVVTATNDASKRKITVKASSEKDHTNLVITYEGQK